MDSMDSLTERLAQKLHSRGELALEHRVRCGGPVESLDDARMIIDAAIECFDDAARENFVEIFGVEPEPPAVQ